MKDSATNVISFPAQPTDVLTDILRRGAHSMLQAAIEAEVSAYVDRYKGELDTNGRRLVVKNGTAPEREIQTLQDFT